MTLEHISLVKLLLGCEFLKKNFLDFIVKKMKYSVICNIRSQLSTQSFVEQGGLKGWITRLVYDLIFSFSASMLCLSSVYLDNVISN